MTILLADDARTRAAARWEDAALLRRVGTGDEDALETLYGHLARIQVHTGEAVTTSTVIGRVGSTGLSTGCHLHFGVYARGKAVDPMGYL